jgi:hypothetical protein
MQQMVHGLDDGFDRPTNHRGFDPWGRRARKISLLQQNKQLIRDLLWTEILNLL